MSHIIESFLFLNFKIRLMWKRLLNSISVVYWDFYVQFQAQIEMGHAIFAIDSPAGSQPVRSSNRTEQFLIRARLFLPSLFLISAHPPVSTLGPSTLRSLRSACPKLFSTGVAPTQTSVTASAWTWTSATFWASWTLCCGCSVCQDYSLNNQLFK